jgi:hypothetical protein
MKAINTLASFKPNMRVKIIKGDASSGLKQVGRYATVNSVGAIYVDVTYDGGLRWMHRPNQMEIVS